MEGSPVIGSRWLTSPTVHLEKTGQNRHKTGILLCKMALIADHAITNAQQACH